MSDKNSQTGGSAAAEEETAEIGHHREIQTKKAAKASEILIPSIDEDRRTSG